MFDRKILLSLPVNQKTDQTAFIQAALDEIAKEGGEVILAKGEWHISTLRMYSNTTLRLSSGTKLLGSENYQDYTDFDIDTTLRYVHSPYVCRLWNLPEHYVSAMLIASHAENVAVIGEKDSVIDGRDCVNPNGEEHFRGPMGLVFSNCRGVTLKGYTVQNSANWSHQIDSCQQVSLSDITILAGHDGFNLHHCTAVNVENCDIRSGDDCIAGYDVENMTVKNCYLNTSCNSFRIGGRNFLIENCRFQGPGQYPHRVSGRHNTEAAFMYYAMKYDDIRFDSENWVIRNCVFDSIDRLFFYDYMGKWDQTARPLKDVTFENTKITNLLQASVLKTKESAPLTLTFKNCSLSWREGKPEEEMNASENIHFCLFNSKVEGMHV